MLIGWFSNGDDDHDDGSASVYFYHFDRILLFSAKRVSSLGVFMVKKEIHASVSHSVWSEERRKKYPKNKQASFMIITNVLEIKPEFLFKTEEMCACKQKVPVKEKK